jgi:hypothetical protein
MKALTGELVYYFLDACCQRQQSYEKLLRELGVTAQLVDYNFADKWVSSLTEPPSVKVTAAKQASL